MRFLKISDIEIKTYATLVSLGNADLTMIYNVMKLEEKKVHKALKSLIQREWIITSNGNYKPINPTKVVKAEIFKFKKDFEQSIERIKSEALVDLETLFEQNNLMYIKYKELWDQIY